MIRVIRIDSTEFLVFTITSGGANITGDTIDVSFDNGDTWLPTAHVTGGVRLLVGPAGDVTLPVGTHRVLLRIHDSPEVPVISAGPVVVSG